jgi:hypothetical protein
LAGKAARNHVNNSLPWVSVEGTNIVPNGEWWQMSFILALHESSGAKGVDFHGANGSPSKQFASKYSASSACEKCQLIQSILHQFAKAGSCGYGKNEPISEPDGSN